MPRSRPFWFSWFVTSYWLPRLLLYKHSMALEVHLVVVVIVVLTWGMCANSFKNPHMKENVCENKV